jgi:hypothetical protein
MNYYPMVWLLWEYEEGEKYLEGVYAHKIKAEEVLRVCNKDSPANQYWIQEVEVEGGTT